MQIKNTVSVALAVLMIIMSLGVCAFAAEDQKVSVGSVSLDSTAKVGDEVTVYINAEGFPDLASCGMTVSYDSTKLKITAIENGTITAGLTSYNPALTENSAKIGWISSNPINKNGSLVKLTFSVLNADAGDAEIIINDIELNSIDVTPFTGFAVEDGAVHFAGPAQPNPDEGTGTETGTGSGTTDPSQGTETGDNGETTDPSGTDSTGGSTTGGSITGGSATGGSATGGSATGGSATGGSATGGSTAGGSTTGGSTTGGSTTGGSTTGGSTSGSSGNGYNGYMSAGDDKTTTPTTPSTTTPPTTATPSTSTPDTINPAVNSSDETKTDAEIFTDIASHWAYESINYVVKKGIFKGVTDTEFDPNGEMTRAMFVTVLARCAGADTTAYTETSFQDSDIASWYGPSVEWAYANKVVSGTGEGVFDPEATLSREQMMTIIYNYIASAEGFEAQEYAVPDFPDVESVSAWALTGVSYCTANGIVNGSDGNIAPQEVTSRAQVSAIIQRLYENGTLK